MKKRLNKSILLEKQRHGSSIADMRNFLTQEGWLKEGDKWLHRKHSAKTTFARQAHAVGLNAAFAQALTHKVNFHNSMNKIAESLEEDPDLKRVYTQNMADAFLGEMKESKLGQEITEEAMSRIAIGAADRFMTLFLS